MTDHDHKTIVPGCYRCELGQDEEREAMLAEIAELRADLREALQLLDQARYLLGADDDPSFVPAVKALLGKHKDLI